MEDIDSVDMYVNASILSVYTLPAIFVHLSIIKLISHYYVIAVLLLLLEARINY